MQTQKFKCFKFNSDQIKLSKDTIYRLSLLWNYDWEQCDKRLSKLVLALYTLNLQ